MPWLEGRLMKVEPRACYGLASDVNLGSARTGTLGHVHRFADRSDWKTTLRLGSYTRDQRASAIRFAPAVLQPGGVAVTQANFGPDTALRRSGGSGVSAKIQDLDTVTLQNDCDTRFTAFGLRHAVQAGVDLAQDKFVGCAVADPASGALLKPNLTVAQSDGGGWVDEGLRVVQMNRDFNAEALGACEPDLLQLTPQ